MTASRSTVVRFALALVVIVAGVIVALSTSGTMRIVGWGVAAVGVSLAVSFAFLEVGLSEDRARARGRD
jgi:hypothetical protein